MSAAARFDDRVAVGLADVRFLRGQPARADVGEVGAHRLRGQDGVAGGDRAGQGDRAVEELAHLAHQRERRQRAAWPPAPAATRIRPSTPASSAFCAWRIETTSCSTMPP
jgi:hypothetical protein